MFLKDLTVLKPGTLVKGLKLTNTQRFFNVSGWKLNISKQLKPIFQEEPLTVLFYPQYSMPKHIRTISSEDLRDKLEEHIEKRIIDPWYEWENNRLIKYKLKEPIGIHLGEFIFSYYKTKTLMGQISEKTLVVYSKMLLPSGEVGYFLFTAENWQTEEMELA
jgi:hypothetical protein